MHITIIQNTNLNYRTIKLNKKINKRDYMSRNKLDNDTTEWEFATLNCRNESKDRRDNIPSDNSKNNMKEHEIE